MLSSPYPESLLQQFVSHMRSPVPNGMSRFTGEPLANHFGVFIDQNTHVEPPAAATTFWAASVRLSPAII